MVVGGAGLPQPPALPIMPPTFHRVDGPNDLIYGDLKILVLSEGVM